ncbi:MAG TPA: type II secretion system protein GspM [Rhodanobacteraceae bacterium]|nr:type II secretion system protein GspM [Rhodanobacteraceae bacterium]
MRVKPIKLSPVQSRLAAIVLAVLALGLAYLVLLHWWFVAPLLDTRAQMHDLRVQHARYAAAIAQQPQLQQRLNQLAQGGASANAFLPETDPSAAAAGLIQRASDVVAAHASEGGGCEMPQKMPIENSASSEPYRRVSVSITLQCAMQPLIAVLHDFDRALPYMFVDDITIYQVAQPGTAAAPKLEVQFTLSGYVRASGAANP